VIDPKTPISEFMTAAPQAIDAGLTVADARDRMAQLRIRHLPVMDDGLLVGIISARDVLVAEELSRKANAHLSVDGAMSTEPVSFSSSAPIGDVVHAMCERDIGAVLVVDDDELVGIFTDVDAVDLLEQALEAGSNGRSAEPK
jgi:acetoin utilization protein AcuB